MISTKQSIESYKELLKNILISFSEVPEFQIDEFISLFSIKSYTKKDIIISPNTINNNQFFFIVKGIVRIYYEANGKEITTDFKEPNTFFVNGYTLFTGKPNFDLYEALEDTICLVANYNYIEELSNKYHEIEHLGRKMVESYYASYLKDNYNKLFLSAEERYDVFMKERISIINQIPLKYIASHLGITPETLSRMRSKFQKLKT